MQGLRSDFILSLIQASPIQLGLIMYTSIHNDVHECTVHACMYCEITQLHTMG